MEMITAPDGSSLAFDQVGSGPPLILVSGAMCDRRTDAALAVALARTAAGRRPTTVDSSRCCWPPADTATPSSCS
jgi:hypothetical protein